MKDQSCCEAAPNKAECLLRTSLGVFMLFAGINKFMMEGGFQAFVDGTSAGFEKTWLPMILVTCFLYLVPFLEVILGVLLITGWKRCCVLGVTGLLMLLFVFGMMVMGNAAGVSTIFIYIIAIALAQSWPGGCFCFITGKGSEK